MSSDKKVEIESTDRKTWLGIDPVILPYAIALLAQLPLLLYYFSTLWARPHYQFFPFALIMVVVLGIMRWPKHLKEPFFSRKLSAVLFWVAILFGIAGALFATAWFSAASMVMLLTSLFARTHDGEVSGKSLIVLGLPLLIILMPPNNLDTFLITKLQTYSAKLSSWYLDVLNFKHYSPGTTLEFPAKQYEVERACSGVQSFFTMLFCTSFLIVTLRRPFFRAIILLLAACFWSILMNSVRILVIPIADEKLGVSLQDGLKHDLLGYAVMLIAIGLILSTDQMLEFLFGRSSDSVDDEKQNSWANRVLRKKNEQPDQNTKRKVRKPVSSSFKKTALIASMVMLLFGGLQFYDFVQSMNQPKKMIRFFSKNVMIDLEEKAMPKRVDSNVTETITDSLGEQRENILRSYDWQRVAYERSDRTVGSDLGQRSDTWIYRSRTGIAASVSLDQTFPGWHELTTCYRNTGWETAPKSARFKEKSILKLEDGTELEWTYIEIELVKPLTAEHGFLLFSFVDASGQPYDAPVDFGKISAFFERAKNRLSHKVRSRLFRGEAYQMQVFVRELNEFSDDRKDEIRSQYHELRKHMRQAILTYGSGGEINDSDGSEKPADSPGPDPATVTPQATKD